MRGGLFLKLNACARRGLIRALDDYVVSMKKMYEAWEDDAGCSTTFSTVENIKEQLGNGLL